MAVELWDDQTRNLIADFEVESDALACDGATVPVHGRGAVATWALDRLIDDQPMICGDELLNLALAAPGIAS